MKYKDTLLCASVFLLGKKKSKISGIYFHASFSTKCKCKHPAKLAFLCQDGLSWGSHLLPWYKRQNGRPRCPGTAPSLSDSWCRQESLLCWAQTFWQRRAAQRRRCLPAHLSASSRNSADICSFLPPAIGKPQCLHYCSPPLQSQPASLSLPEYKLSNLVFQEGD